MNQTRSLRHSALALAIAAAAGLAFAQSTQPVPTTPGAADTPPASPMAPGSTGSAPRLPTMSDSPDAAFRQLDSANRGFLSRNEVQSVGISFEEADTNKDGRVSKEEFERAWSAKK